MWYKVDWNILAILNLPTMLRKPLLAAFVQILLKPLNSLYYLWYEWRIKNIYKIEHSGQVCYLRKSLNEDFDPIQNRIWIGEGTLHDLTYIYTEPEKKNTSIYTEPENKIIWLRTELETADTGLDFIVWVPMEIFNSSYFGLDAHVKFYKAGGKRYKIMIDE